MTEWQGIQIGLLRIHRLEQWDLGDGGVPFIAAHWRTANASTRVFAVYRWGIEIGPWRYHRHGR